MREKIIFDYSKLKGKIVENYGTQGKFATVNNLTDRSISLKLNNGIGLSQDEILKWCELLDIEIAEIPSYFFTKKVSKLKQREDA
ncbi:DUF739 family protein [Ruminococcus sp. OA3]|uniref:DUF739 family protein n=1 Tax=Ruminococcus sp. OA3 TaxID=2914164 RepID=UPI001F052763|nr:DUF739 family protein [Ruminococcus sp. OA3]MCH1982459.1 DUF739 family protein [Ruminococcus sp. OA3]